MPLADARAMVRALTIKAADETADGKLLRRVADWCERFTPMIALDGLHGLLLDITGVSHLFGGERALLEEVLRSIGGQGFAVQGAIAETAMAARALARCRSGVIAEPGEESVRVAPLPIAALDLDPETIHALRCAGLKTIGQVAGRSRAN